MTEPIRQTERMTSKERVLSTFAHAVPDRVPVNYDANPGIDARLKDRLGIGREDHDGLLEVLGVDFRAIGAPYTGPTLHENVPGRQVDPVWGIRRRWIEHDSGGYWDYCDFPLKDADEEQVAQWPMPSADDFDYSGLVESCKRREQYALYLGNPGLGCIINTAGFFRGMEQTFVDLITDDAAGLLLIDRFLKVHMETTERALEKVGKLVDFIWMGEDLGTQLGTLISMALFKKHILPRHREFLDLAKAYNLPVMLHTCGSSSWTYEEYIKAGLKAVDTLQPEAGNMCPEYLKKTFGGRLVFHGCISTAGPVAYGSVEDVRQNVLETLEIMMPGSGYCFAPTHSLQDNTPTENAVEMYRAAHLYGRY
jgi:uroporphyrinogen decarboxylase